MSFPSRSDQFFHWLNGFTFWTCVGLLMFGAFLWFLPSFIPSDVMFEPMTIREIALMVLPFALLLGIFQADRFTPEERRQINKTHELERMYVLLDKYQHEAFAYLTRHDYWTLVDIATNKALDDEERHVLHVMLGWHNGKL
jgi:hypothetical protein